ncbi:MAG: Rpn family recombination-promoting nuclease/putative transposase [Oscillospiraceae bacterium]|nr:Rpn family recombination-promoting nuclease/putative transposase [Oscillospiraceae bacterium]
MSENNTGNVGLKILQPKVDVAFKRLFGDERNIGIITDFVNSVLTLSEDEYKMVTIEDVRLEGEISADRLGVVYVKLTLRSGKVIFVEMWMMKRVDAPEKAVLYYHSQLVSQLESGDDYYKLKKIISIAISADFEITKGSPEYHNTFQWMSDDGVKLSDAIPDMTETEIHTLELHKLPEQSDGTAIYDWLRFLKMEREEEFDILADRSKAIKEAVDELKRLSQEK